MMMKSMRRMAAVTRVRMQIARMAPSWKIDNCEFKLIWEIWFTLFGEVEVPVSARMNFFPISTT